MKYKIGDIIYYATEKMVVTKVYGDGRYRVASPDGGYVVVVTDEYLASGESDEIHKS